MAERIAEIIVLAEDLDQGNFARHFLVQRGHNPRNIRLRPFGSGSGEQHVRERYPEEVKHHRNQATRRKAALVVVIDADRMTVDQRERQLEGSLKDAGEGVREPREVIVLLIPKRHIETWILCLTGESVDEIMDYKGRRDIQGRIKPAAQKFNEWSQSQYPVPDRCVDSLRRGLFEARRIQ